MIVLFQNTTNDTSVGTGAQRRVAGWQFTASLTGQATTITLNITAAGHQVKVGIYDRPASIPGNLLGGESNLVTTTAGINTFILSAPAPLIAGTTYSYHLAHRRQPLFSAPMLRSRCADTTDKCLQP